MSERYADPPATADGLARLLTTYSRTICEDCTTTLCGLFRESWGCPPAQVARMRAQAIRDRRALDLRRRVDLALSGGGAA